MLEVLNMAEHMPEKAVWIVEHNRADRAALSTLVRRAGIEVFDFEIAGKFLAAYRDDIPGCLVIDFSLPDLAGRTLYQELLQNGCEKPVIFISDPVEVAEVVSIMQMGATDFVQKPIDPKAIISAVESAIAADIQRHARLNELKEITERLSLLSERENQIMQLIVEGMTTKRIARELSISPKTVGVHRINITKKMHAVSVPHLINIVISHKQLISELHDGTGKPHRD